MEPQGVDLILPASYDIVWFIITFAMLVLFVVAFIKWAKVDFGPGKSGLGWLVALVLLPIIGSIVFLVQARAMPRRTKVGLLQ